ncbi:hypothetical protein ANN_06583 [Periplaneta americana]|uniref:Polyprotein n=1 Tax=Periplaneta americana TaxID=6978 RepID=A0ABQ8TF70_PERAM|nr:hypothetical protein ANN_06583 [Periplaneta americana]
MAFRQSEEYGYNNVSSVGAASGDVQEISKKSNEPHYPNGVLVISQNQFNKCCFYGFNRHKRSNCPALNAICCTCEKKGHCSVCQSKRKVYDAVTAATDRNNKLSDACISWSHTLCGASTTPLHKSMLLVKINGVQAKALIDTRRTTSFINSSLVNRQNFETTPANVQIAMASSVLISHVRGSCNATIELDDHIYLDVVLLIMDDDHIIPKGTDKLRDIIRNIKSRRLRWAGHVARMGKSRHAYRLLVGRPEGKRPLGRPRHRWEDNIKMDLREVGYDDREWINLAQDRDQ